MRSLVTANTRCRRTSSRTRSRRRSAGCNRKCLGCRKPCSSGGCTQGTRLPSVGRSDHSHRSCRCRVDRCFAPTRFRSGGAMLVVVFTRGDRARAAKRIANGLLDVDESERATRETGALAGAAVGRVVLAHAGKLACDGAAFRAVGAAGQGGDIAAACECHDQTPEAHPAQPAGFPHADSNHRGDRTAQHSLLTGLARTSCRSKCRGTRSRSRIACRSR
jgi:hypothetical protein